MHLQCSQITTLSSTRKKTFPLDTFIGLFNDISTLINLGGVVSEFSSKDSSFGYENKRIMRLRILSPRRIGDE